MREDNSRLSAPAFGKMPALEKPIKSASLGELYVAFGWLLGSLAGVATFLGGWVYCTVTYGFLFGFGLGWLPSGLLAIVVAGTITFLWLPIIVVVAWAFAVGGS